MKYIRQLDSIRAIAVLFVIVSHWVPSNYLINKTPNGAIGVNIFFVLSGYLISRILFEHRNGGFICLDAYLWRAYGGAVL